MIPELLYEDAYCVVVNKPNDLIVHHSYFARNIEEESLVDGLRRQTGLTELSPVHRLDRKTSGVLLLAKKKTYVSVFQQEMESETVQKTYWALVRGFTPEEGEMTTPVKNERGNYKEAFTSFRTLKRFERDYEIPPYPSQRYSLIAMFPKTGRYHQLRIHANKMAHPIINDPKHGNRHHNHFFTEKLNVGQLFLHAVSLKFEHPFSGDSCTIRAGLPAFWKSFFSNEEWEEIKKLIK